MARDCRWVAAAFELVLCGVAAAVAADATNDVVELSLAADTLSSIVAAGASFIGVELLSWTAARLLNVGAVRWWVRGRRRFVGGLSNELASLAAGAVLYAVWAAGPGIALFIIAATVAILHARLVLPLRARRTLEAKLVAENEQLSALVDSLAAKNAELDEVIKFRTDLMSMLGHEISNPLTSILGFSQIAIAASADGDAEAAGLALATVERNARKVADVVSDIRELVASERGAITAEPRSVRLKPHLRAAIEDRTKGTRPALLCRSGTHVSVQPGHLDQILANLLANAAKYAGGATEISVVEDADQRKVRVVVADEGPGISEEHKDRLFERFWRGAGTKATVPGTGIGLFISRELARANGGDLTHENASPSGSRFVLTLASDLSDAG